MCLHERQEQHSYAGKSADVWTVSKHFSLVRRVVKTTVIEAHIKEKGIKITMIEELNDFKETFYVVIFFLLQLLY